MKPRNIKRLQLESRKLRARWVDRNTLAVESSSNSVANHIVTVYFNQNGQVHARCTCPWAMHRGIACSHVMAALEYLAAHKRRKLSFWSTEEEARRQKQRVFYLSGSGVNDGVWITSRTSPGAA